MPELTGRVIPFERVRAARNAKPTDDIFVRIKAHKSDDWTHSPRFESLRVARDYCQKWENPIYEITVNGQTVDKRSKTRATAIGGGRDPLKPWSKAPKIATSGHVQGMTGVHMESATGFNKGPMELPPVTVLEEYRNKKGQLRTREIRTPDDHQIVSVRGKRHRIRKPRPGHKWESRASKAGNRV